MPLFAGLEQTEYQDVLRAIGRLLDSEGFRSFRLLEHEDGVILQGMRHGHALRDVETYRLPEQDIQALLRDAYQLRGRTQVAQPQSS